MGPSRNSYGARAVRSPSLSGLHRAGLTSFAIIVPRHRQAPTGTEIPAISSRLVEMKVPLKSCTDVRC